MYEDKAKRMGIDIPMLNISAEDLEALKRAMKLFKDNGIEAFNVDMKENAVKKQNSPIG